jgi:hypothetical protein
VLQRAGFTLLEIGGLLGRDHSTVIHAIRQVERSVDLTEQGRELVESILPFLGEAGDDWPDVQVPDEALPRALLRALWGRCNLQEMRAVRAYVLGPILGFERVRPAQAMQGFWVIATQPVVQHAVEAVLEAGGHGAYGGLIRRQVARAR